MTRRHDDRGAATTELVLLTPILIVMLLFVVALGRIAATRQDVDAAARDAARAAANARSSAAARAEGTAAAATSLREQGTTCRNLTVTVDTAAFRAGGTVTAAISCTINVGNFGSLFIPASRTITATFTAPVDYYRGVS